MTAPRSFLSALISLISAACAGHSNGVTWSRTLAQTGAVSRSSAFDKPNAPSAIACFLHLMLKVSISRVECRGSAEKHKPDVQAAGQAKRHLNQTRLHGMGSPENPMRLSSTAAAVLLLSAGSAMAQSSEP